MTTVDRILELVKESGLTAKEFAEGANIAGGSITDWKTGRSKPSIESLQKIAKYTNVQLEWLTGDTKYKTKADFLRYYNNNLYKLDIDDAILRGLLNSIVDKKYSHFADYMDDIKNFLASEKNIYKISKKNINEFLKKYPNNLKSEIEIVLNKIIKDLKHYQDNRNIYSTIAINAINEKYNNTFYMCPVYGQISAGQPNWAEECIEGRLPIDPNLMGIVNPEEHFFLRVNGESMNNVIKNGAFALIHKQDMVEDGEIAVVLVNGYDATLKRFTKKGDVVVLEPDSTDSSFKTQIYDKTTPIKILGKYVGKMEINN